MALRPGRRLVITGSLLAAAPPLLARLVHLDQSIKQPPARRRIGGVAFSEYSKAGDLGYGIAWYATLGIGAALVTVVAAISGRTWLEPWSYRGS